jgi:hypothetical protein
MLTVRPHGVLARGFDVVDGAGAVVGAFVGSAWRENGRIQAGYGEWEFRRERSRRFVLTGPQGMAAAADRTSLWSNRWQVSVGPKAYELAKPSWLGRRYELRDGGRAVGDLRPRGVSAAKAEVALPPELPPAVQVFVVAVVMTLWRREQSAATAGAAGGAAAASG